MNQDRTNGRRRDLATTRYVALQDPQARSVPSSERSETPAPLLVVLATLGLAVASLIVALSTEAFSGVAALWAVLAPFVVGVVALAVSDADLEQGPAAR